MNELFGLSMTYIAGGCVIATSLILLFIAFIAVRNPVMFKMGLRNIPRRKAQTALIVVGLMLSTLIMTSAFGTGDTLTKSITSEVYSVLGEADEAILWDSRKQPVATDRQVIPLAQVDAWRVAFAGDPDIEALVPFLSEVLPVQDTNTRLNESSARIVGFRAQDARGLGGLRDTKGQPVELTGNELAVNAELADKIDAQPGHTVLAFYQGAPVELRVKAIVPNEVLSGAFTTEQKQGGAVDFGFLATLTGKGQNANGVFVSNRGGVRAGLAHAKAAEQKLKAAIQQTTCTLPSGTAAPCPYRVEAFKQDGIRLAELFGNLFTTFFIVLGLFSIAAGILLIFLIFVMLAAERKPEMGMARAVGAKRRQLVESFLAEGMGYDLGSAVIGMAAGIGVTYAMVGIISWSAGASLGLNLAVEFTPRSLVTAFSLGIITTFIVIFISSWRASRLNIVAAIRDLPESPPLDPEAATWTGYFRAVLNGVALMALPLGFTLLLLGSPGVVLGSPLIVIGLISPWFYTLRGSNFAAQSAIRTGEGPPKWPWITGLAIPVIGWVLILPWYFIALLLVRVTRDRKPARVPLGMSFAGIVVPPLGFALALLQDTRVRIAWAAGIGTVMGVIGLISTWKGLESDRAFFFAGGVSLIFFWLAVTLRYFHIAERLSFTATSGVLLLIWYLTPSGKLEWLLGPLNGDIEMFFLSGVVMVTAGTFITVYNADIILPAVAKVGSRFGRITPAIKTAVAYPLTSKFRTGMTMAMIGLIMFALVMNATLNSNFAAVFLNSDTRGGFDVQVVVNRNNPVPNLPAALSNTSADPNAIAALGELRVAMPSEVLVENRDGKPDDDGQLRDYLRYTLLGADDGFLKATTLPFKNRAQGYGSDRDVWDAIRKDPSLAVIPALLTGEQNGFGGGGQDARDLLSMDPLGAGFQPITLKLQDPGSGKVTTITVIGQLKEAGDTFWPGIITGKATVLAAFPESRGQRYYLSLKAGVDAGGYAKQLEAGLVQASADSLQKLLDDRQRLQNGFLTVFQGFMGLGLIVGIAALGVVASRAVVERRQQIGMLRAIGYQRSMVALSFLFESGFIALSGILLGLGLGLSLAWVLFTSGSVGGADSTTDVAFQVPWLQLGIVSGVAFFASMLMTFLPARAASRVPVAEALRYE